MYNKKLTNKNKNSSKEKLNYTLYYIVQCQFDVSNYYSTHKPLTYAVVPLYCYFKLNFSLLQTHLSHYFALKSNGGENLNQ